MKHSLVAFSVFFISLQLARAQQQKPQSSAEIYQSIQKLNFLGSVLYVAAHPDDENNALISYLSNHVHARVGYLAMTRGDGGQNILGPEIRELLGVIRTEELLAARQIDGGEQFFTRANDFGYSKTPEETFAIWDKAKVLSDVVWEFRKFRPDIIINRFDHRTEGDTHGHHTASARLSVEAFDLSGDSTVFSKQLNFVKAWQPKRLYLNQSWYFYGSEAAFKKVDKSSFKAIDVGVYYPERGLSNTELAAKSRSQHKSQGFGATPERGVIWDYLEPIKGEFPDLDEALFEGINTSWSRLKNGKPIGRILTKVERDFDFKSPSKSIPQLLKAYQLIQQLQDPYWRALKLKEIKSIIIACAGIYVETSTAQAYASPGQKITVNFEAINRSDAKVELQEILLPRTNLEPLILHQTLSPEVDWHKGVELKLSDGLAYSSPYWLNQPHSVGMYTVTNQQLIGLPDRPKQLKATFGFLINGVSLSATRNLVYKHTTPTQGEVKTPFAIVPEAAVELDAKTIIFASNAPKQVQVKVSANTSNLTGDLELQVPKGWKVNPQRIPVQIAKKGKTETFTFSLTPPKVAGQGEIIPKLSTETQQFTKALHNIDYKHIPAQTVLLPAKVKVLKLAVKTAGKNIAYIEGAGDDVAESLRQIGYRVTVIPSTEISAQKLAAYDAVVLGIRAYDVDADLVLHQQELFTYVKRGGTLITQYNTIRELKTDKIAPFQLSLSHDRVTDENSPVSFLVPEHQVLNWPNSITKADFEGWVQERGLYFADQWNEVFTPVLGMRDPGETSLKGGLLIAPYGKGHYVYTGLSFFRELPAGVPGAFRLFANLLALDQLPKD